MSTVPDVSVFHHKKSIVFQLGAWLCKHETALPHTIHLETIPSSSSPALALTESIHVVMSLYLMSVYSIARSQLCFNWVLDYVSMRLLSPNNSLETIVLSCAALALTESIHVVMSLYLMWVYSSTSIVFQLGAWLCSMRLLSSYNSFETIRPQLCCSGTHRINTRSNVTVPDVSVIPSQEVNCVSIGCLIM